MFESLSEGLQGAFKSLSGKGKLTESNMREGLDIVQKSLLEADVSYPVIQDFMSHVSERALGKRVLLSLRPHQELVNNVSVGCSPLVLTYWALQSAISLGMSTLAGHSMRH